MLLYSGAATGGQGGQSATPDSEKFAKKMEKNQEKLGKKRKNREEKAKIGKVLSLCPSWQPGLATLLCIKQWLSNLLLIVNYNN